MKQLLAVWLAGALALLPAVAGAADGGERSLPGPADLWVAVGITAVGLAGVLFVAALGYLYRRERRLSWDFQRPDPPAHH